MAYREVKRGPNAAGGEKIVEEQGVEKVDKVDEQGAKMLTGKCPVGV